MSEARTEQLVRAVSAAIRTEGVRRGSPERAAPSAREPFVTISREAGTGGEELCERLVARLNQLDPDERPWEGWDRQLVEKVASDHRLSRRLVEDLDERTRSWIENLFASPRGDPGHVAVTEPRVYRGVVETIRALASAGRVVIVGRGGVYIARDLKPALHVRLEAPSADRVAAYARRHAVSEKQAQRQAREIDRRRAAFFRRYWPNHVGSPFAFGLTLNTAAVGQDQAVEGIAHMVLRARQAARAADAAGGQ